MITGRYENRNKKSETIVHTFRFQTPDWCVQVMLDTLDRLNGDSMEAQWRLNEGSIEIHSQNKILKMLDRKCAAFR